MKKAITAVRNNDGYLLIYTAYVMFVYSLLYIKYLYLIPLFIFCCRNLMKYDSSHDETNITNVQVIFMLYMCNELNNFLYHIFALPK
jgi:hypothetical protein